MSDKKDEEWDEKAELAKANRWWKKLPTQTKIDIMYDWGTGGCPELEPTPFVGNRGSD